MDNFIDNFRGALENSENITRELSTAPEARRASKNNILNFLKFANQGEEIDRVLNDYYGHKSGVSASGISYFPFTLSKQTNNGIKTQIGMLMANDDGYIIGGQTDSGLSYTPNGIKKFLTDAKNSGWTFDFAEKGSKTNDDRKKFIQNDTYDKGEPLTSSNPLIGWNTFSWNGSDTNGTGPFYSDISSNALKRMVKPATDFIVNYRRNRTR